MKMNSGTDLDYNPDSTVYGLRVTAENASTRGVTEDIILRLFVYEALLFVPTSFSEECPIYLCLVPIYRESQLPEIGLILREMFKLLDGEPRPTHLGQDIEIPVRLLAPRRAQPETTPQDA
jgi:hypothetical protein